VTREDLVEEREVLLRHLACTRINFETVLQGEDSQALAENVGSDREVVARIEIAFPSNGIAVDYPVDQRGFGIPVDQAFSGVAGAIT